MIEEIDRHIEFDVWPEPAKVGFATHVVPTNSWGFPFNCPVVQCRCISGAADERSWGRGITTGRFVLRSPDSEIITYRSTVVDLMKPPDWLTKKHNPVEALQVPVVQFYQVKYTSAVK